MLFRFSQVDVLDDGGLDDEHPSYLGTVEHSDYVHYMTLLKTCMKENIPLSLVQDVINADGELVAKLDEVPYIVADIKVRVSLDKTNIDCVEVYLCEI